MKAEPVKCTQWYPGDVEPVRKGVYQRNLFYQRECQYLITYSYWNGEFWGSYSHQSPRAAFGFRRVRSGYQNLGWRGVAK